MRRITDTDEKIDNLITKEINHNPVFHSTDIMQDRSNDQGRKCSNVFLICGEYHFHTSNNIL